MEEGGQRRMAEAAEFAFTGHKEERSGSNFPIFSPICYNQKQISSLLHSPAQIPATGWSF
jgi:hypothetical protein